MDELPEALELHHTDTHVTWRARLLDHAFWLLSRGLLIVFIVVLALVGRIPFHHLLQRDVVLEREQIEKERMLERCKLVDDLSLYASKVEACFTDSVDAVLDYVRTPSSPLRDTAEVKHRLCNSAIDKLREHWGNRQVKLDDDIEEYVNNLIHDAEQGLKVQADVLGHQPEKMKPVTFGAYKCLVDRSVDNINQYGRNCLAKTEASSS
jgi:hypothetical protein